jgi:hypothetical protein
MPGIVYHSPPAETPLSPPAQKAAEKRLKLAERKEAERLKELQKAEAREQARARQTAEREKLAQAKAADEARRARAATEAREHKLAKEAEKVHATEALLELLARRRLAMGKEQRAAKPEVQTAEAALRRSGGVTPGGLPMDPLHKRVEKLLAGSLGQGETVLARVAGGADQALILTEHRALIIKIGFMAGQTFGGKVTSFEYRNITAVEVRMSLMTGSFEISAGGVQGAERSYWKAESPNSAWKAPNTIPINRSEFPKFQLAANAIRERSAIALAMPTAQSPASDVPDQLRRLADLRDQGVLTNEEFQAKKTELLARM